MAQRVLIIEDEQRDWALPMEQALHDIDPSILVDVAANRGAADSCLKRIVYDLVSSDGRYSTEAGPDTKAGTTLLSELADNPRFANTILMLLSSEDPVDSAKRVPQRVLVRDKAICRAREWAQEVVRLLAQRDN